MTVIAMTQEMATLGTDVTEGVAKALGLRVVRHEVGDQVAERMQIKRSLIRRMREGEAGWFEKRRVDTDAFLIYSADQVFELALEGDVVIRGWGATFLLKSVAHVPCIRICAPFEARVKWLMQRLETDDRELAREELERSDNAHAARIQQNFGVALADPLQYDLTLNTGRMSIDMCVEQIVTLSRRPELQPTEESIARLRNLALQARIRGALKAHEETVDTNVTIDVDNAAVTLRGIVVSANEKTLVEQLVRGTPGVTAVDDQLRVMEVGTKRFTSAKFDV
jgi:cytidylate kinase